MYHRFEENKYPSTNIRISDFLKHLEIIQNQNIQFINPKNFEKELLKNKKYQFKSGGDHLMLFDVERDLKKGDDVDFLFTFQLKNKKVISKSIQFKVN